MFSIRVNKYPLLKAPYITITVITIVIVTIITFMYMWIIYIIYICILVVRVQTTFACLWNISAVSVRHSRAHTKHPFNINNSGSGGDGDGASGGGNSRPGHSALPAIPHHSTAMPNTPSALICGQTFNRKWAKIFNLNLWVFQCIFICALSTLLKVLYTLFDVGSIYICFLIVLSSYMDIFIFSYTNIV